MFMVLQAGKIDQPKLLFADQIDGGFLRNYKLYFSKRFGKLFFVTKNLSVQNYCIVLEKFIFPFFCRYCGTDHESC